MSGPQIKDDSNEKVQLIDSPICCIEVVEGIYHPRNLSPNKRKDPFDGFGVTIWSAHKDGNITVRSWEDGKVISKIITPLSNKTSQEISEERRMIINIFEHITAMLHVRMTAHVWCTTDCGRIFVYDAKVRINF